MSGTYSPVLVALSIVVALLGSYVALSVAGRVTAAQGRVRLAWLAGGGVAMGVGIWSMHFVGMLAMHLPVPVGYDVPLWLLSMLVSIGASIFALYVVSRARVGAFPLLLASLLMGVAIAGMHYIGMAAMRLPGSIDYHFGLVVASVGIAIVAALGALWIAFRLRAEESRRGQWGRVAGAMVMGLAIAGMHYTGMAAARFHHQGRRLAVGDHDLLATHGLAASVVVATVVILGIALLASAIDRELRRRSTLALEKARLFREAEAARREARQRAEHAEELAEELQHQAVHLEEQAAELEAANDELLATEARLRAVIDASLDAVVGTDSNGAITDWSRAAEAIFGWSAEEAVGRRLDETIIPVPYREAHRRGVEHYLATGEGPILNRRIEITALHRDGHEFPVELTVSPARSGNQVIFTSFVRDITSEKRLRQRLAAENAVTRILAESHRLDEAAPRIVAAIGETLEWSFGAFWSVPPEGEEMRCIATWRHASYPDEEFENQTWRTVFHRGEGLPGRVWAARQAVWVQDIAEETNFPRAALAGRRGLRSAFAFPVVSGPDVLAVVEFFYREPLQPNPNLLEMVAAIGADIGQAIRRVRAEEERDRALAEMARVNVQLQEANEALQERTSEAERARLVADEANRAKSDFLANMSHELRTPINAIVGFADLLDLGIGGSLTDTQRSHLERIRASSDHLLSLVNDVLDLSKIEAGRMGVEVEHSRVGEVVDAAVSLVAGQAAQKAIEIENRCPDPGLSYLGDDDRVRQILLNLLSNAVKFTPEGGRIQVRCGSATEAAPGAALQGEGPWTFIEVEDTGIGIGPEDAAAVFDPFVQAETGRTRTHGGTGLGLTISRRLARLMGGDLTLQSELGRGSRFTLWLPATGEPGRVLLLEGMDSGPEGRGLAAAGEMLQAQMGAVLQRYAERVQQDPLIPMAATLSQAELEDHQASLLADLAQTLIILDSAPPEDEAGLLQDGSDLQRLIAVRHGMQRARHHWTAEAMRREYAILREEVGRAAQPVMEGQGGEDGTRLLDRLLALCEQLSLRGLRAAEAGESG